MNIIYNKKLKNHVKELRNNSTLPEVLFWKRVKNKQLGCRFYRQKPIDNYIVDFYCAKHKLVIEIDGRDHELKEQYDDRRERDLEKIGLHFIRFSNHQIYNNLDGCIDYLERYMKGDPNCDEKRPL